MELPVYLDLEARRIVQGPDNSSAVTGLVFYQNDTYTLALHGLKPRRDDTLAIYDASPIPYNTLAAGLFAGGADAGPLSGTWKLTVTVDAGSPQTTGTLQWNQGKQDLATALNALSGVAVTVSTSGPDNFYTVQQNDPDQTFTFEGASVALAPNCLVRCTSDPTVPGRWLIKLIRAPLAFNDDFENALPPAVTVATVRAGNASRNEIQSVTEPEGSMGQFALGYSGAETIAFPVGTVTAAEIEDALNALSADATEENPSFRVTQPVAGRRFFHLEFIGALALANQDALTVSMYGQVATDVPTGEFPIVSEVPVDLTLLAAANIPILFEIAAFDVDGKKTVLAQQEVTLVNNAIDGSLAGELESAGYVQVVPVTQYLDTNNATPFIQSGVGQSFTPTGALTAGSTFTITHGLDTFRPWVRVTRYLVDHTDFAAALLSDPGGIDAWLEANATGSVPLQDPGEIQVPENTTRNQLTLTLATALVDDPADDWDYHLIKIDVSSPDAIITLFTHLHSWDEVYDSVTGNVGSGLTVRQKFAALEAGIGMLGGGLKVPAGNIDGKIPASKIDVSSFIENILNALQTNATTQQEWTNMIISALTGSSAAIKKLIEAITSSASALDAFRDLILDVLKSLLDSGVSADVTNIPDVSFVYPPYQEYDGPSVRTPTTTAIEDKSTTNVTKTYTATEDVEAPGTIVDYANLSPAQGNLTAGTALSGTIVLDADTAVTVGAFTVNTGTDVVTLTAHGLQDGDRVRVSTSNTLPSPLVADTDYYIRDKTTDTFKLAATAGGSAIDITTAGTGTHTLVHYIADSGRKFAVSGDDISLAAVEGLDSLPVPDGSDVAFANGHWFIVSLADSTNYPKAYEKTLFVISQTDQQLVENAGWNTVFRVAHELRSLESDLVARGRFILETAPFNAADATPTLDALTWTERASFIATLTAAAQILRGSLEVNHRLTSLDTFTANASTEVLTVASAHGLAAGDRVKFTTSGTLPAGLALDTIYYVIASGLTSTELKVSATDGGSAVNITDTGTGTHTIWQDTYDSTARMGGVEEEWTPVSLDLFVRLRFDRFDTATPDDSAEEIAGALLLTLSKANHSLIALS